MGQRILLAEDDASMRELLERVLVDSGYDVSSVSDGKSALARLGAAHFDLVVTDLRMPGADGLEVLRVARQHARPIPTIVLTAFGTIAGAVDAMRLGASDYLTKPLPEPQALRDAVARALVAPIATGSTALVAHDPAMVHVLEMARRAAAANVTVLLLGESGVGKEVVAQLIHETSPRSEGPFVAVNCAALAEGVQESELFGHERGAFTDARVRHLGTFERAHGGTLFLDEVAETSASLQAKLLRVLQDRTFTRVGGEQPVSVDVRLVAATNKDLQQAVGSGAFREDLYYRLAVFPIAIPPLRERPGDILPLAQHFLQVLGRAPDRTVPPISPEAKEALLAYSWPGNVRELQNVIERSVVLAAGGPITAAVLGLPAGDQRETTSGGSLKEMEQRAIRSALAAEGGNRRRAAQRLGIALRTLQYKLKEYGIS